MANHRQQHRLVTGIQGRLEKAMAKEPLKDEAEVEVICPRCGYHLRRTAGRLRRDTPVVCPNCGEQVVPASRAAGG
jgi:predicted RNA-binding Zn-ribbon protein involved in translation (DUF1610 family)